MNYPEESQCVVIVIETDDGWSYNCLCGFESMPTLTESQAQKFAAMHENVTGKV